MNSITQAMQTAGVRTPTQLHRIWTWVQDHQPQSAKQIALALKLPQASSMLSQMEQRGMVTSTLDHDRSSGFHTKRYSVVCSGDGARTGTGRHPGPAGAAGSLHARLPNWDVGWS